MTPLYRASVFAVLAATLLTFSAAPPAAKAVLAAPAGARVLGLTPAVRAALRNVRVKVLYPAVVPVSLEGVGIALESAADNAYSLDVVASPACVGVKTSGGACNQASVEGARPVGPTPAGYVPVKLSDGSTGHYTMRPCGANCEGSFELTFVRWNTRYTIFVKAGTLAQGLAIERGLRLLR
jgi:hypothetical protein